MNLPDYLEKETFKQRSSKRLELFNKGINPYPYRFNNENPISSVKKKYENSSVGSSEEAEEGKTDRICVAGRLVLFRSMGKNVFAQILEGDETLQIMLSKNFTNFKGYEQSPDENILKFIEKKIDLGDFIGIEGFIFRTKKGELTVLVKNLELLTKTLLSLPDKHFGLMDKEVRYRKRWLDMIANPEVVNTFLLRSRIIQSIRNFLNDNCFIEVETPILQSSYGGANASPFKTHMNALHEDMFMRISLEIALKKILVGGMPRVFEIGKVFRNEGLDRTHNPEFTMLEAYAAYWDYTQVASFVENMIQNISLEIFGTTEFTCSYVKEPSSEEKKVIHFSLKAPWKRMTMIEALQVYSNIDVNQKNDKELKQIAIDVLPHFKKEELKALTKGSLVALLFDELVSPLLIQPHHIFDHPIETTPLCKIHRNNSSSEMVLVERFESFVLGNELCNAYSELNDPILQRQFLEEQIKNREKYLDKDNHPLDEEFLEALSQGLPPTGGFGIGIDRLVMLLTNVESIRDVLFFPIMKHV